jgi:hypothetical protein
VRPRARSSVGYAGGINRGVRAAAALEELGGPVGRPVVHDDDVGGEPVESGGKGVEKIPHDMRAVVGDYDDVKIRMHTPHARADTVDQC